MLSREQCLLPACRWLPFAGLVAIVARACGGLRRPAGTRIDIARDDDSTAGAIVDPIRLLGRLQGEPVTLAVLKPEAEFGALVRGV